MENRTVIRHDTPTRQKLVDEFTKTQPTLELLLQEIRGVAINVQSIQRHLDEQDKKISILSSQTNLAGNIAAGAEARAEEALIAIKETRELVRKIDQSLFGVNELAKSGFDIATTLRSQREHDIYSDPVVEILDRDFTIVGTGN